MPVDVLKGTLAPGYSMSELTKTERLTRQDCGQAAFGSPFQLGVLLVHARAWEGSLPAAVDRPLLGEQVAGRKSANAPEGVGVERDKAIATGSNASSQCWGIDVPLDACRGQSQVSSQ